MPADRIFISYAREDEDTATRLFHDLKKAGFNPWIDKECLLPGENWQLAIRRAIENSSNFILLMSAGSVGKTGFINKEIRLALDSLDRRPESSVYFIPVRIDECKPPFSRIEELHWLDLFPSYENGFARLVASFALPRNEGRDESVGELKAQLGSSELSRQLHWRTSIVIRRPEEASWWRKDNEPWSIEGDGLPARAIKPGEVVHLEVDPGRYEFRVGYSRSGEINHRNGFVWKGSSNSWKGVLRPGINKFECRLDKGLSLRNVGSFATKAVYWLPTGVHFSYESLILEYVGFESWSEPQEG